MSLTRRTLTITTAALVTMGTMLPSAMAEDGGQTLREAAGDRILVGTAIAGGGHHEDMPYENPFYAEPDYRDVLEKEFSSVTPENQLKLEFVEPEQGKYNFGPADDILAAAEANGQQMRGHAFLWHSQNPQWLEDGDFTPDELHAILKNHIQTLATRYKGKIYQWDVSNEIFDEQGNLRTEENIWIRELGPEIIGDAFRWAHEADPDAKLFFNAYSAEGINPKSDAYYELTKKLLAEGVPVHGFSAQAHFDMRWPYPDTMQENLQRFDDLGLETAFTEVDVRFTLPEDGKPTEQQLADQAEYYQATLGACLAVEGCKSFTIWGFTDTYSWVPVFFEGTGAATVMFEDYSKKPAYHALIESLEAANTSAPSEEPTAPSEEPTAPAEDPSETPSAPAEDSTAPSEEPTAPTEEDPTPTKPGLPKTGV